MSSIKAFLSDHETGVDLLNNQAIAATIVDLLREKPERPVTVGVHGDWGAGKSSILEMIEMALGKDSKVLCLKFNGWRFQGFEDAKIALIEGIVTGLLEKRPALTKASDEVKEVFKRIDWLKLAKMGGGLAVTAMTGLPSPALIQSAVTAALGSLQNKDNAEKAIEGLQGLLKPKEDSKNVPEEVAEFIKAFDKLLAAAEVDQLVVLIDDLDRCLPDTAIETLEAIRLFVFTPKTAFVVAADEAMIEYSVRKHFPDLPNSSGPQTYARNYLEKLIQIPFRIPPLGEGETRIYVALALAEASLGQESKEFQALLEHARDVLKRPWLGAKLEEAKVRESLGDKHDAASQLIVLSDKIGPILARGTSGNPRQLKRFLNAMLLRERIATARGFGDDVKTPVLAKLMLAERFNPRFFDQLVIEVAGDPAGLSKTLKALETVSAPDETKEKEAALDGGPKTGGKSNKVAQPKKPESEKEASPWAQDGWIVSWLEITPALADTDLRPYVFVANQQARMAIGTALGPLIQIVNRLMGGRMAVAGMEGELKSLTPVEVELIMQELTTRVRAGDLKSEPSGIEGIKVLGKTHPSLQPKIIGFLRYLPVEDIGTWAASGWSQSLAEQKQDHLDLLNGWGAQEDNPVLASVAKTVAATL